MDFQVRRENFFKIIKARSHENKRAMELLVNELLCIDRCNHPHGT